jgi:hypothetical protein
MDRRLRFRWLAILVVVVLLSCPAAYMIYESREIIKIRRDWYARYGQHRFVTGDNQIFALGDKERSPSQIRMWLGDQCYDAIVFDRTATPAMKDFAARYFPEANIYEEGVPGKPRLSARVPVNNIPLQASLAF